MFLNLNSSFKLGLRDIYHLTTFFDLKGIGSTHEKLAQFPRKVLENSMNEAVNRRPMMIKLTKSTTERISWSTNYSSRKIVMV